MEPKYITRDGKHTAELLYMDTRPEVVYPLMALLTSRRSGKQKVRHYRFDLKFSQVTTDSPMDLVEFVEPVAPDHSTWQIDDLIEVSHDGMVWEKAHYAGDSNGIATHWFDGADSWSVRQGTYTLDLGVGPLRTAYPYVRKPVKNERDLWCLDLRIEGSSDGVHWYRGYYAGDIDGKPCTWVGRRTSLTTGTVGRCKHSGPGRAVSVWNYARVAVFGNPEQGETPEHTTEEDFKWFDVFVAPEGEEP